jgi:hypothetical protein
MGTKRLTVSQHKVNKINKKRANVKEEKDMCRNEKKLLKNITKYLPEEIVSYIYTFVDNDIKFNLSHYKTVFTKFIYDISNNRRTELSMLFTYDLSTNRKTKLSMIFTGYTHYNYCTYQETVFGLKEMLRKIPFEKLEKYILFGTPSKYFNIAFPDEPDIKDYIAINYKNKPEKREDIAFQRKNYIFEIIDLLSYFSTKANEWHAAHCKYNNKYLYQLNFINRVYNDNYLKQTEKYCKENEMITKNLILSILYIYQKYTIHS